MIKYICRSCASQNISSLGKLPTMNSFAGKPLMVSFAESSLYKCNDCSMLARHPVLTEAQYNKLYAASDADVWRSNSLQLRKDQQIARSIIMSQYQNCCSVLDIGCYTGDLLASLPDRFSKNAVEMSENASRVAESKAINIVGKNLYEIDTDFKFDLIVAIDVIEHTINPAEFLLYLAGFLKPNGAILISTGNADNWVWERTKNKFWYSSFYEHISFISQTWLAAFCDDNGYSVINLRKFCYAELNFKSFIKASVGIALTIFGFKTQRFSNFSKDHFCFLIKAKA